MNKCNFCVYSKPTGDIGGWRCDNENNKDFRVVCCRTAIKQMNNFNEVRANGNMLLCDTNK